jgi:large subunit ribosomal protein L4
MELSILNRHGEDTGRKIDLPEDIFNIEPNDHAIYLDVKQYLANQRQGNHKAKERADISGSTKKIKRQKGTGTARAGSIKSPIFRGGGRIFGPRPRDYGFKVNKKTKALARKSALSYKAKENNITILEQISFENPKTKDFIAFINGLDLANTKTLYVVPESDINLYLSSRNVKNSKVILADTLNTYEVLHCDNLIISEKSLEKIKNNLGGTK